MSQRFIIDVNINGARGEERNPNTERTSQIASGAVLAGSAAGIGNSRTSLTPFERFTRINDLYERGRKFTPEDKINNTPEYQAYRKSLLGEIPTISRENPEIPETPETTKEDLKNTFNFKKASATASLIGWKALHTVTDIANHKSGNTSENQKRNNAVKSLSYLGVFVASPMAGAALLLNEAVNMISNDIKYSHDRKMEDRFIKNSGAVLGDVSYGRSRGMGI